MDQQINQQILVGIVAVAVGAAGWLLPFRWNPLRLKRIVGRLLPENAQVLVPKILGTICLMAGIALLVATAIVGKFQ